MCVVCLYEGGWSPEVCSLGVGSLVESLHFRMTSHQWDREDDRMEHYRIARCHRSALRCHCCPPSRCHPGKVFSNLIFCHEGQCTYHRNLLLRRPPLQSPGQNLL